MAIVSSQQFLCRHEIGAPLVQFCHVPAEYRLPRFHEVIYLIHSVMSEQDIDAVVGLRWNDNISVVTITLITYDYILLLEKEIKYVWKRPWTPMSCLYLVVRYLGLVLALLWGCWGGLLYMPESPCYGLAVFMEWGYSAYSCIAEGILIWRLYAVYNCSKLLLRVLLAGPRCSQCKK